MSIYIPINSQKKQVKSKIKQTFGVEIPHWRESLAYCVGRILARNANAQQANG